MKQWKYCAAMGLRIHLGIKGSASRAQLYAEVKNSGVRAKSVTAQGIMHRDVGGYSLLVIWDKGVWLPRVVNQTLILHRDTK